jgi:hypothetical protein
MSEHSRLDQGTYEASRKYLKSALEHVVAAGRNARDLTEFVLEKFGDEFRPYLHQFFSDVRQGKIDIKGLTHSARTAIVGHHVSQEERERMIREAAYLRSEQRGFAGGYEHDDWHSAEKEVDERLEREAGLMEKGGKALASAAAIAEKEFKSIKQLVTEWLEEKPGATLKSVKKAATKKKSATVGKKAAKAAAKSEPKEARKKPATVKKAAVKKTVKKASVTKKQTKPEKTAE